MEGMELKLDSVIKREMKSKGLTLTALAKATGIPLSSLHNWLAQRSPAGKNLPQLKRLSEFFGITLSSLLFNVDDEGSKSKTLFRSEFIDANRRYRLTIEKLEG